MSYRDTASRLPSSRPSIKAKLALREKQLREVYDKLDRLEHALSAAEAVCRAAIREATTEHGYVARETVIASGALIGALEEWRRTKTSSSTENE